jgi:hypothetical protein
MKNISLKLLQNMSYPQHVLHGVSKNINIYTMLNVPFKKLILGIIKLVFFQ